MTATQPELPAIDWTDICGDGEPSDRTPTPFDLRQHEMRDQRGQGARPKALWTADNVPTGSYL